MALVAGLLELVDAVAGADAPADHPIYLHWFDQLARGELKSFTTPIRTDSHRRSRLLVFHEDLVRRILVNPN